MATDEMRTMEEDQNDHNDDVYYYQMPIDHHVAANCWQLFSYI